MCNEVYLAPCQTSGAEYLRMDQVKFFKDCLPQILLEPLMNTLSHL